FSQPDQLRAFKVALKEQERGARGSTEMVNRLVGIADSKNIALLSGELLQDFDLGEIDVLKFVHQDEARAGNVFAFLLKPFMRPGDHVPEGSQIVLAQHSLHGGEDAGNFPTAPQ